jgi:hypothetical protein
MDGQRGLLVETLAKTAALAALAMLAAPARAAAPASSPAPVFAGDYCAKQPGGETKFCLDTERQSEASVRQLWRGLPEAVKRACSAMGAGAGGSYAVTLMCAQNPPK